MEKKLLWEALEKVHDPELGRSIVDLKMVKGLEEREGKVKITLALTTLACPLREILVEEVKKALSQVEGVREVEVTLTQMSPEEREALVGSVVPEEGIARRFNNIGKVIAVMSGKGGVGKSLVAALLAIHLRRSNYRVGIMDADITGPSIPKILGVKEKPIPAPKGIIPPASSTGIKVMSIDLFLLKEEDAVIWRGPLIAKAIQQFWGDVFWGELDYMIVDLPPGTADASLTVMQSLPLNGIILVTSPQELVRIIVKKATQMARHLHIPIIGVVENMSYAICPDTGTRWEIFGPSKGEEIARELKVPLLAKIPIDPQIARLCDEGRLEEYHLDEFEALAARIQDLVPEVIPRFFVSIADFSEGD
ncbi:MAG: Mrp/NBP35 family ATP-binding protein [Anaerolineae bacterium]|nr:Mrp/NBP35 family ATP-binding protein [Anaerolineae bacterium]MDW8102531.1 Mrp/NBP35 family ATP-binding protein [Anaerolineae bacterium]